MPIDYSKFDNIELSDDSDIEGHPNVDKKSLIRAKQAQIHEERFRRKQTIKELEWSLQIKPVLLERLKSLLKVMVTFLSRESPSNEDAEELMFELVGDSRGDSKADQLPPPPEHVKMEGKPAKTYTDLLQNIQNEIRTSWGEKEPSSIIQEYLVQFQRYYNVNIEEEKAQREKLAELKRIESSKITSDGLRDGFNSSSVGRGASSQEKVDSAAQLAVAKPTASVGKSSASSTSASTASATTSPSSILPSEQGKVSPPGLGHDDQFNGPSNIAPSAFAKVILSLPTRDYHSCQRLFQEYWRYFTWPNGKDESSPADEVEEDLLSQAFSKEGEGNKTEARHCAHQIMLFQSCRALVIDRIDKSPIRRAELKMEKGPHVQFVRKTIHEFFQMAMVRGSRAHEFFDQEAERIYAHIQQRLPIIEAENRKKKSSDADNDPSQREVLQLQTADENIELLFRVPSTTDPEDTSAREIFDSFPNELKEAIDSGKLSAVNEYLEKLDYEVAERFVDDLRESGILSVQEGVIDTTTEEGKQQMEEIERLARKMEVESEPGAGEPGPEEKELKDPPPAGGWSVDQID